MRGVFLCAIGSILVMGLPPEALAVDGLLPSNSLAITDSTTQKIQPPASTGGATTEPKTDTAASGATQGASGNELAEIIVTAQRRIENLQRAAVPVDVVSAQDVLRAGVSDPTSLGELVPALTVTPAGGSRQNFFLRGVGNFTANPIFESAIAFNYDDVYIAYPGSTSGVFYDLQRIEVLKGPQGTLYGRNATGGAINVDPEHPHIGEYSGYFTGSYGNYNAVNAEGAVNMPVGEHGALRLSGNYVYHNGYLTDGTSDENTTAGRVQFLEELTPSLKVRISADAAHVGGSGVGTTYVSRYQFNPATDHYQVTPSGLGPSVGFYDPAGQAFRSALYAGPSGRLLEPITAGQYTDNRYYGVNGDVEYDTAAGVLTVIPAFRYSNVNNITETVGFPAEVFVTDKQSSLEARFVGNRVGPIDYTFGAFSYYETHRGGDAVNEQALANYEEGLDLRTRSLAGFGRLTFHVTDQLRVVGAARYTSDRAIFSGDAEGVVVVCVAPACPNAPLLPLERTPQQLPPPVPPPGGAVPLGASGALLVRTPSIIANDEIDPNKRWTYRAAVEYDVAPRSLLYSSVETGFRSGGFNLVNGYATYKPEFITAYTVGSKNRFLDNRLQLNDEAYIWKYSNQQLAHVGIDAGGRQGFFVQNLGNLTIFGDDVSALFLVTPTTVLNAQVQYLHTKYDQYSYQVPTGFAPPFTSCGTSVDGAAPAFTTINCAGKPGYNSPRWTLNLGADQTVHLNDYKLVGSVFTQFRTSRYVGFDYVNSEETGSTWETGAQLTFAPASDVWSVTGFVRNIENNRYLVAAASYAIGSAVVGQTAPPRVFGIRGSYKF